MYGAILPVQVLLPVHALGDRLDHEVAFAQQFEVLVVVGRLDRLRASALPPAAPA